LKHNPGAVPVERHRNETRRPPVKELPSQTNCFIEQGTVDESTVDESTVDESTVDESTVD